MNSQGCDGEKCEDVGVTRGVVNGLDFAGVACKFVDQCRNCCTWSELQGVELLPISQCME